MDKVEVCFDDKSLIFEITIKNFDWCTVWFAYGNNKIKLGSDSLKVIKEKMMPLLKNIKKAETNLFKGVEIFYGINLVDPHASLCASKLENHRMRLYFFANNGDFYPLLDLTQKDVKRLVKILDKFKV